MLPSTLFVRGGACFKRMGLRVLMVAWIGAAAGCTPPSNTNATLVADAAATAPAHGLSEVGPISDDSALCCGPITAEASRVLRVLEASNIRRLWANGRHIDCNTGMPDRPLAYVGPNKSTHCSCFAAAMAKRLGIYLLRPPEHPQQLLANAQVTWLNGAEARQMGWIRVSRRDVAQRMANQGAFVMAAVQNANPRRPGHVTIVRPEMLTRAQMAEGGLMLAHSGFQNKLRVNEKTAFVRHPGAWPDGIRYFAHPVP